MFNGMMDDRFIIMISNKIVSHTIDTPNCFAYKVFCSDVVYKTSFREFFTLHVNMLFISVCSFFKNPNGHDPVQLNLLLEALISMEEINICLSFNLK